MKAEQQFKKYRVVYDFHWESAERDIHRHIEDNWFVVTMLRMQDKQELWVIYEKHYDEPKYTNIPRIQ